MKIQQFLEHHGIAANPFAEEDAQTDPVFKEHCIASMYHPAWDKIFGNPADPATSVVFGEKGSGKTAIRLQIAQHLAEYNRTHPQSRLYVVEYDDFNPFLDRFQDKLSRRRGRRIDRMLAEWRLWDHMDAILTIAVTRLVDEILTGRQASGAADWVLDRNQARDLLLLAACYDQSMADEAWPLDALAPPAAIPYLVVAMGFGDWRRRHDRDLWRLIISLHKWSWLSTPWPYLAAIAAWVPRWWRMWKCLWQARGIVRRVRVGNLDLNSLRRILQSFTTADIAGQPLPNKDRTDDRYELLIKFQGLLKSLGYSGIVVLVDRVDEPHLINGSAEPMRALLWPMLDNKFLKHPGMGFKLLLPIELSRFIEREENEFFQRSRLDKQNMIPSLEWTGEALYDLASARVAACAKPGEKPTLSELFDPAVSRQRLVDALRSLRVPRHLFKFMYRLLVAHCNAHTDDDPAWQISGEMFEATLAVYRREQDAFDRGVGVV